MKLVIMNGLIIYLGLFTLLACDDLARNETGRCKDFEVLGYFYEGETVDITVDDKRVFTYTCPKNIGVSRHACVDSSKDFIVKVRLKYKNKLTLDTAIVVLSKNGAQGLVIPVSIPKYKTDSLGFKDSIDFWMSMPVDRLKREAFLKNAGA